jgi:uncharacterized protein DUF6544
MGARDNDGLSGGELPPLVRGHLERNVPAGERGRGRIRFSQVGEMQLRPGRWMAFRARQELAADRVEFAWRARFVVAPLVWLQVVDWYREGVGGLHGRVWGLVPVIRARGPEIARGEAMRYLSELAWVPQALRANRELQWRQLDESRVEVATRVASSRVAVTLRFDVAGDIVGASGVRPRMVGRRTVDTPFSGSFGAYKQLGGVRVPTTAVVAWELPEGPFTYFRGRLLAVEHVYPVTAVIPSSERVSRRGA